VYFESSILITEFSGLLFVEDGAWTGDGPLLTILLFIVWFIYRHLQ
jgi:hypothetical protein